MAGFFSGGESNELYDSLVKRMQAEATQSQGIASDAAELLESAEAVSSYLVGVRTRLVDGGFSESAAEAICMALLAVNMAQHG